MKLYEISEEIRSLLTMLEDAEDEDAMNIAEAISLVDMEFDKKAINTAKVISEMKSQIAEMKEYEKRMAARRKSLERSVESLNNYIFGQMETLGKEKIEDIEIKMSIRNNPESVQIDNEEIALKSIPNEYIKTKVETSIDKTALKTALKNGEHFDGISLIRTRSLMIK